MLLLYIEINMSVLLDQSCMVGIPMILHHRSLFLLAKPYSPLALSNQGNSNSPQCVCCSFHTIILSSFQASWMCVRIWKMCLLSNQGWTISTLYSSGMGSGIALATKPRNTSSVGVGVIWWSARLIPVALALDGSLNCHQGRKWALFLE